MSTPTGEITKIQLKTKVTADKLWVKTASGNVSYKLNGAGSNKTATPAWVVAADASGDYTFTNYSGDIYFATSDTIPTGMGTKYDGRTIKLSPLSVVPLDKGEPLFNTNNNTLIIGTDENGNASHSATIGDWWSLVDKPSVHVLTVDSTCNSYDAKGYNSASNVYRDGASALASIPTECLKQHEICVIRQLINSTRQVAPLDSNAFANGVPINTSLQKTNYMYGVYVYDLSAERWQSMGGSFDARNVYLSGSVKLAGEYTHIGNMNKGDVESWKLYDWDGMSVQDVLTDMFQKELDPTTPTPTISMSLTNKGSYEIGSTVTPSFSMTYNPGKYKYGSETYPKNNTTTNAQISACTITLSTGGTLPATPSSKTLAEDGSAQTWTQKASSMVVTSSTNYYGSSISCTHGDGAVPYTNIKNSKPALKVTSDTITNNADTNAIVHYREGCFYGAVEISGLKSSFTTDQVKPYITANIIRNLDKKLGANYSSGKKSAFNVIKDDTIIIVACPSDKTGPTSILNTTVNAEIFGKYDSTTGLYGNCRKFTMSVGGADSTSDWEGDYPTDYNVWYYIPDTAYDNSASITVTLGE